jgi:predicted N-acetyltransferase YhbS
MEISLLEKENINLVKDFYLSVGHTGTSQLSDTERILVAREHEKIIGAVRLVNENGVFQLRTMDVLHEFQKQGIGLKLLESFVELLGNQDCYCIAYAHLKYFYGKIGFEEIVMEEAPQFLQERIIDYRSREKNIGKEFILMKKSKI